jgi:uncharacterized LabA/DUF88 family protein
MKPNMALRMGRVDLSPYKWRMKPQVAKELVQQQRALTDDDFELDLNQKGVDMRIGMDRARPALRQMVRAVIVVTGDADFVPAFKYVRREGGKAILDTMGRRRQRGAAPARRHVLKPPPRARRKRVEAEAAAAH